MKKDEEGDVLHYLIFLDISCVFGDLTDCSVTVYSGLHVQSLCGLCYESPASSNKVRSSSGTNECVKVSNRKMKRKSRKVRRLLPKKEFCRLCEPQNLAEQ